MERSAAGARLDHFLADDGARIPLHVHGRGPALVLVSGWTAQWQDWLPVVQRIQDRFTCYIWEPRPSQATAPNPTIERMGRDLQNLLDACGLERPLLMSHSMGTLLTWEYLRQFGNGRLSALCLIDQTPRMMTGPDWDLGLYGNYTESDNARFIDELLEDFPTGVLNLIRRSREGLSGKAADAMFEVRRQFLASLTPSQWITAWQSFVRKDYRDVLPAIEVPTFLAYGGGCRFYGPRVAEYVQAKIRNSELQLYAGVGHSPQVERPDDFVRGFLGFVDARF